MRQIKFRAWDDSKKEWLFGYEMENLGGFSLFGEVMLMEEWAKTLDMYLFNKGGCKFEDLKVMQFTGLLDKNGKEIYEGDIVEHSTFVEPLQVSIGGYWEDYAEGGNGNGVHVHNKEETIVRSVSPFATDNVLEIIGNIYENPELLK